MTESSDTKLRILVVEDNESMREGMSEVLRKAGHEVTAASAVDPGLDLLNREPFDLVIADYKMPGKTGLELLAEIKTRHPETEAILVTAFGTIDLAVEAMKQGAWDFITKPFSREELSVKVGRVGRIIADRRRASRLAMENRYLREEMETRVPFGEIIGDSPRMKAVYRTIAKVAGGDTSVLVYGESGTGKELVARAVHLASQRREGSFIRVNCAALAEGVLESELFGHERGAFTGAMKQKKGRFELADHGTLFLDEIGDLPSGTQVKLLRVLQEKEFERVGGEHTLHVDVRLIAATHKDLLDAVKKGSFREDLYYRLHVLPIQLPPLRERKEDIPQLAVHFLKRLETELNRPRLVISEDGLARLSAYDWPGNVRELQNVLERAAVLSENGIIDTQNLSFMVTELPGTAIAGLSMGLEDALASLEQRMIEESMRAAKGVKARAARLLGIKENVLHYKLKKYGM
jgi:two-component system response regulator HydG